MDISEIENRIDIELSKLHPNILDNFLLILPNINIISDIYITANDTLDLCIR